MFGQNQIVPLPFELIDRTDPFAVLLSTHRLRFDVPNAAGQAGAA